MLYHYYGLIQELGSSPFSNATRLVQNRAADEPGWIGKPVGVAAVLLAALVTTPNFFLNPTRPLTPVEATAWTGDPSPIPSVLLQLPAQPSFTAKLARRFDHVPEPGWLGEPSVTSNVLFQIPAQQPFTVKRFRNRFDHVPEPGWLGEPTATTRALLALIGAPNYPLRGTRQFVYVDQTPNFQSIALTIPLTPQAVLPFFNARRTSEHVPEPVWLGKPKAVPGIILQPPPVVLPFANTPWKGPIPDPNWVVGGGSVPQVLLQFPAVPPFTVKGTRRFDYVPEPGWLGEPQPVSLIYTLAPQAVLPFSNRPRQPLLQVNYVPDTLWTGDSTPYPLTFLLPPSVAVPFSRPQQNYLVAEPIPSQASKPIPQVLQRLPAVPSFTVKGTRQFHVPDFVPWSMSGHSAKTPFLPVPAALQTLKNAIERVRSLNNSINRVRSLDNSTDRVRSLKNSNSRRKP